MNKDEIKKDTRINIILKITNIILILVIAFEISYLFYTILTTRPNQPINISSEELLQGKTFDLNNKDASSFILENDYSMIANIMPNNKLGVQIKNNETQDLTVYIIDLNGFRRFNMANYDLKITYINNDKNLSILSLKKTQVLDSPVNMSIL